MCDNATSYAIDWIVYTGRPPGEPVQKHLQFTVVDKLTETIKNSERNVTTDNFFMSIPLAKRLSEKRLSLLGTLGQNKSEITPFMKSNRSRPLHSSLFGFSEEITLVNYATKPNKSVMLLSTMHNDKAIMDEPKRKPEMIGYYTSTKSGVDSLDQKARTYYCKRQSKR